MLGQVRFSPAGEGTEFALPDGTGTLKISGQDTGGAYELFEVDAPRLPAMPPHSTPWAKSFYVLHGQLLVQVDDEGYDLGPGCSVTIPGSAMHTFTVLTPSARFLAVSLTDAMSRFFADFTRSLPVERSPEDAELAAVLQRHGVTMANGQVA